MLTAVFAVCFAGVTAFAVLTIFQFFAPAMGRIRLLAAYAQHNDGSDWALVSYQNRPVYVPGPRPNLEVHLGDIEIIPQVAIPRWQSWCPTGYVAPPYVAAKWNARPQPRPNTRCLIQWSARPRGKLSDIIPDCHSRVAEPSDYAVTSSPPPHLSIGFLAAQTATPYQYGERQRLLS